MEIPIYLALTPAEFLTCAQLPPKTAWMACHFSSGGSGLSNLPQQLPEGSLLILDDSAPYQEHDADLILSQLSDAVAACRPEAVLLDFQRPGVKQVHALTSSVAARLPCPVAVSSCYAGDLSCPVFLPPGPLWQPLSEYLKPYALREIWLDAAPVCEQVVVSPEGATCLPTPDGFLTDGHFDPSLHCHYEARVEENSITFTLSRACEDLRTWLEEARSLGVSRAVGLYQELKQIPY